MGAILAQRFLNSGHEFNWQKRCFVSGLNNLRDLRETGNDGRGCLVYGKFRRRPSQDTHRARLREDQMWVVDKSESDKSH
jgi:hypothetical protein